MRLFIRNVSLFLLLLNVSTFAQDRPFKPATPAPPATPQPAPRARSDARPPQNPLTAEFDKYPGLMEEFGRIVEKLQHNVQLPPDRAQSHLLPLLPQATAFYGALANYGDVAHVALQTFREELQQSAVLRDWYRHGDVGKTGPKIEDAIDKFDRVSQYLGDEIVLSATSEGKNPSMLFVAEARKPGLKPVLQQIVKELAGNLKSGVRVLDMQDLAAAAETTPPGQDLIVLVRPDYVVASGDLAALRSFNARLESNAGGFASSSFGQRLGQAYEGGASSVGGVDVQALLKQVPTGKPDSRLMFQRSGFADMKYTIWQYRSAPGSLASEGELSFTGPRHGAAAWLAAPSSLDSLTFVDSRPMFAAALQLEDPALIFDDLRALSGPGPNPLSSVSQMEQALGLSLKDDLLRYLTGEITLELDRFTPPAMPAWKAILRVSDPVRLQQSLRTLLQAMNFQLQPYSEDGINYYTVRVPSQAKPTAITYAFVDGYLVVAPTPGTIADAVRLHRNGASLAKSQNLTAALPPGHPGGASALFYQDPLAWVAVNMARVAPDLSQTLFQQMSGDQKTPGNVITLYGEPNAIRMASKTASVNAGVVLVAAAIAIPNLLRARMAANEASAVGKIRTVNTAQVTYASTYPQRGFASDLASLGPGASASRAPTAAHAALLDQTIAGPTCTDESWCEASGFRFRMAPICKVKPCRQYLVVATPVTANSTGQKSFCSTSDGVIRFTADPKPALPTTAAQCRAWQPLQ